MKTLDWNDVKLGTVVDLDPLSKPVEVLIMGSIGRGSGLRLWLVQRRRFAFPESESSARCFLLMLI